MSNIPTPPRYTIDSRGLAVLFTDGEFVAYPEYVLLANRIADLEREVAELREKIRLDREELERVVNCWSDERAALATERAEHAKAREDAARWRAFVGCARIRLFGWAGYDPNNLRGSDPNYRHFGAEFWTMYGTGEGCETSPDGRRILEGFADAAIALSNDPANVAVVAKEET